MELGFVLLWLTLLDGVAPVSSAAQRGLIESLYVATLQRPWLWAVYVFTIGLPVILFISFMWPDKRFGPPDQPYYYKKSDDLQPDDPHSAAWSDSTDRKEETVGAAARRREPLGKQKKSDLDLKDDRPVS